MIGHAAHRPRITRRLGQVDLLAVIGLGARLPQRAQRLDGRFELVQPRAAGGNGSPNAACSRSHQPAPMPAERPAAGEHVERGDGLGQDSRRARKVTGVTSVPSRSPGVQAGQQAERHPGLGDGLPGPARLRDLDQVVHQRDAARSRPRWPRRADGGAASRAGRPAQPEPGHVQDEAQPGRAPRLARRRRAGCRGSARARRRAAGRRDQVPALGAELIPARRRHPAELGVQHGGGHGRGPAPALRAAAQPGIGVEQHGDGGQPGAGGPGPS